MRDGNFEFQVLAVTSANTVSDPATMTATAQGVTHLHLSVRNIGGEPRSYYGQNQKLIDMSGREYQVSSDADLYMNSYGLVDDINPGNAIEVKVPFDVPPDTQMSMLELHDSMFSAGVRERPRPAHKTLTPIPREQLMADWEDLHPRNLMADLMSGLLAAESGNKHGAESIRPHSPSNRGHTVATTWPQLQLTQANQRGVFWQLERAIGALIR